MPAISRRKALSMAASILAASFAPHCEASAEDSLPLKVRAERRGLAVGCAIDSDALNNPDCVATLLREFSSVTSGYEMKWGITESRRGTRNFTGADAVVNFCRQNGLHCRGHTLVWYYNLPAWLGAAMSEPDIAAVFRNQIDITLSHFGDRVTDWDILNEIVDPNDGRPDYLRKSPWIQALGEKYPEDALFKARERLPQASLFYNDYGVEYETSWQQTRRAPILRFLERIKKSGAPLDGFGLQSHIFASGYKFNAKAYREFLREVAGFGLRILLTELDCRDNMLPGDVASRDRIVADMTRQVLDVALDEPAVKGVTVWGVADPQSWLNIDPARKRKDGLMARPLPFDESYRRKPMWEAIATAIDAAPGR